MQPDDGIETRSLVGGLEAEEQAGRRGDASLMTTRSIETKNSWPVQVQMPRVAALPGAGQTRSPAGVRMTDSIRNWRRMSSQFAPGARHTSISRRRSTTGIGMTFHHPDAEDDRTYGSDGAEQLGHHADLRLHTSDQLPRAPHLRLEARRALPEPGQDGRRRVLVVNTKSAAGEEHRDSGVQSDPPGGDRGDEHRRVGVDFVERTVDRHLQTRLFPESLPVGCSRACAVRSAIASFPWASRIVCAVASSFSRRATFASSRRT